MLRSLFGNTSAERALLFLWVNEQCYASQIHKAFGSALTPFQNILSKFEKSGILTTSLRGNKKLYRLNLNCPFYPELKALLQKGFAHLSPEEKKRLFVQPETTRAPSYTRQKKGALFLQAFWERMLLVQRMTIRRQTGEEAIGEVKVQEENPGVLLFTERGKWVKGDQPTMAFHNTLRWTFEFEAGLVRLEHLRYGPNHPIFLTHLLPTDGRHFHSVDPHLCQEDCYFGRIECQKSGIYLTWRIVGARKNETLHYVYI